MSIAKWNWVGLLSVLGVGCGGLATNGLFDSPGSSDDGGAALPSIDASGGATTDATSGAVPPAPEADAGSSPGYGGTIDAGHVAPGAPDAGPRGDAGGAGPGPTGDGVRCGYTAQGTAAACPAGAVCCVTSDTGNLLHFDCLASAAGCPGLAVPCDERADCPAGMVCCGQTGPNGQYTSVQCQSSCNGNQGQYELCNPYAPTNECAASNLQCQASTVLPGYSRCAP